MLSLLSNRQPTCSFPSWLAIFSSFVRIQLPPIPLESRIIIWKRFSLQEWNKKIPTGGQTGPARKLVKVGKNGRLVISSSMDILLLFFFLSLYYNSEYWINGIDSVDIHRYICLSVSWLKKLCFFFTFSMCGNSVNV